MHQWRDTRFSPLCNVMLISKMFNSVVRGDREATAAALIQCEKPPTKEWLTTFTHHSTDNNLSLDYIKLFECESLPRFKNRTTTKREQSTKSAQMISVKSPNWTRKQGQCGQSDFRQRENRQEWGTELKDLCEICVSAIAVTNVKQLHKYSFIWILFH